MSRREDDPRLDKHETRILGSQNRMKLGVFSANTLGGVTLSHADGSPRVTWEESVRLSQKADRIGLEAMIPVARWRGYGGDTDTASRTFETFTWASAIAAQTESIHVFSTFHVPLAHPVMAAKMSATIDHISGGRFGLNIVAGSILEELAMFGAVVTDHDERYAYADEWATLIKRIWTEDEFDFEGRYFTSPSVFSEPKPLQKPYPVIMSAGASVAGQDFAAKHADLILVSIVDTEDMAAPVQAIRERARQASGQEIRVFGRAHITCGDTEAEARRKYDYVVKERGDYAGAENIMKMIFPNSQSVDPKDVKTSQLAERSIAGFFAYPLTGTPEQIVEMLTTISDAGFDGLALSWHDYDEGLDQLGEQILPLMEDAGLRTPFEAGARTRSLLRAPT